MNEERAFPTATICAESRILNSLIHRLFDRPEFGPVLMAWADQESVALDGDNAVVLRTIQMSIRSSKRLRRSLAELDRLLGELESTFRREKLAILPGKKRAYIEGIIP